MKNNLIIIVVFLLILKGFAWAQFFPHDNNIDKLEKNTAKAEKEQAEAEKKAEQIAKVKAEHKEQWDKFSKIREEFRSKYLKSTNSGKTSEIIKLLSRRDLNFFRGKIYFYLEQWSKANIDVTSTLGDKHSGQNMNGEALELYIYTKFASEYEGENFDTKINKKLLKVQKYILNTFLPSEEKKEYSRHKNERIERLGRMKTWVEDYMNKVKKSENFIAQIKEDTKNAHLIWTYFHFLQDELHLHLKAQEWIEVLSKEFPDDPYVEFGYPAYYRNEYTGRCGELEDSIKNLASLRSAIPAKVENLRKKKAEIAKKMKTENIERKDLTETERRTLDMEVGDNRERLAELARRTGSRLKDSLDYLDRIRRGRR